MMMLVILSWQSFREQLSCRLSRRLLTVLFILGLLWLLLSPAVVSAYAGLGGYISEKLLGDGTASSLYLGDSASGPTVIATVPTIATGGVTDNLLLSGGTTATLHGTLSSLNGMPQADVWFVWGDSPSALTNTTPAAVVTTTGDKTAVITGYDPGGRVYYQFRASTDGIAVGATESFIVSGGRGSAYYLMWNILTLLIAAGIFIAVLQLTENPVAALIATLIGLLAFVIVRTMLRSLL